MLLILTSLNLKFNNVGDIGGRMNICKARKNSKKLRVSFEDIPLLKIILHLKKPRQNLEKCDINVSVNRALKVCQILLLIHQAKNCEKEFKVVWGLYKERLIPILKHNGQTIRLKKIAAK